MIGSCLGIAAQEPLFKQDLAYGKHKDQRLDLYAPVGVTNAPIMVYVHGGGWTKGDKKQVGEKANFFAENDWLFISTNYRLLPDGKHPNNAEDVATALAWAHNHATEYGGDPNRLFLMGHSAGGHLAALVATDPRHLAKVEKSLTIIKGVIALDTQAYDLRAVAKSGSKIYQHVFGTDEASQRDASPISHIKKDRGTPPFLICYSKGMGIRKQPFRREAAHTFSAALNAAGIFAEVVDASDRTHGQINQRFGDPADEKVTGKSKAFLDRLL